MAKINGCVKCLFIFFNVLFMIVGCLLVYGAFSSTIQSQQLSSFGAPNLGWSWVFALGVLGISSLGIYAACSEKPVALKTFAGFMVVGMIIMLVFGIFIVLAKNKVQDTLQGLEGRLNEDKDVKAMMEQLQEAAQCCGVVKAEDWGDDIPTSCGCQMDYGTKCRARPQGTRGPDHIYQQPCKEITNWLQLFFQIAMGICFAFAVTALLGLLISLLMIHQVKRHDDIGTMAIAMRGY